MRTIAKSAEAGKPKTTTVSKSARSATAKTAVAPATQEANTGHDYLVTPIGIPTVGPGTIPDVTAALEASAGALEAVNADRFVFVLPTDKLASVGLSQEQLKHLLSSVVSAYSGAVNLGKAVESLTTTVSPQLARSVQATENLYRGAEAEFEMLTSKEADAELGGTPGAGLSRTKRRDNKLLGYNRGNRVLFPKFQFAKNGEVNPTILELLDHCTDLEISHNELFLWLFGRRASLNGDRPVDHLDDTEAVLLSFGATFEVEW